MSASLQEVLGLLGKRFVAYHPGLADLTGSPKAALMLGHALYMSRIVLEKQPDRKGWFWKTAEEWRQATGLSVREVETARKILTASGILLEQRKGMPAKLWFRVDLERLAESLCQHAEQGYRPWSWEDRILKAVLGRPVVFYAPFAWIAQSATAGLYLSALFHQFRQALNDGDVADEGWITSPLTRTMEALHLGQKAVRNARRSLREASLIEEQRENQMQAELMTRIAMADLPTRIALEASKHHCLSEYDKQECRNTTNKSGPKRETRVAHTAEQDLPEAQNNSCPKRGTSSAERAGFSNKEINTPYLLLHNREEEGDSAFQTKPPSADDLVYPESLLPGERRQIASLVAGIPEPQLVLDELAGAMSLGRVTKSAVGYLKRLAEKQQAGVLVIEFGHRVAEGRERRAELMARRQQVETQKPPTPVDMAEARTRMASVRSMFGWDQRGRA